MSDYLSDVLHLARQEAGRLGHSWVGTEHLLLALARQPGATAGLLAEHDLTLERLQLHVTRAVGWGELGGNQHALPLDPLARLALELASCAKQRLRAPILEPTHVLLALIFDLDCVANRVLRDCHAPLDTLGSQAAAAQID